MEAFQRYGWFVAVALFGLLAFGLRRGVQVGPLLRREAAEPLRRLVRTTHVFTAVVMVAFGFSSAFSALFLPGLVPGLALGYPVGVVWGDLRIRRTEFVEMKPDSAAKDDGRLPCATLEEGPWLARVHPLPLWLDAVIVCGCQAIGWLAGWAYAELR